MKLLKSSNAEQKEAVAHLQEMLCYYEHLSNEYMMSCKSADSIDGIENILVVFKQAADSDKVCPATSAVALVIENQRA